MFMIMCSTCKFPYSCPPVHMSMYILKFIMVNVHEHYKCTCSWYMFLYMFMYMFRLWLCLCSKRGHGMDAAQQWEQIWFGCLATAVAVLEGVKMLWTMLTSAECYARSQSLATEGAAKTDDSWRAYGRVQPGTKESRSRSRSSSSGGPTKYKQHCKLLLQTGQLLGFEA